MASIQGMNPIAPVPSIGGVAKPDAVSGGGKEFSDLFHDAIGAVEQHRIKADEAAIGFMNGETTELHQVILAGQRAEIAFETFLQVRNKVVQAYQEVMRMQM